MMQSKAVVYTVLAVALGYFLISAVPDQLETFQGVRQRGGAKETEGLTVEVPETTGSDSKALLDESISSLESAITEGTETEEAAIGGVRDGAITVGLWMVNLTIALAVYFIVKRRLS